MSIAPEACRDRANPSKAVRKTKFTVWCLTIKLVSINKGPDFMYNRQMSARANNIPL